MPRLRQVSGKDIVSLLTKEGFRKIRQKGSHVRLALKANDTFYYITVPLHSEVDRGTLKSIIRSLERCLNSEKIKELFY
ncbi:MAG: type II toxin-antitoxin system HicA family toxin [Candidatus Paceibacterota bacterium]|jgi:predicted RNA binding protein YcfA (HicA-like mRNA interferase family)